MALNYRSKLFGGGPGGGGGGITNGAGANVIPKSDGTNLVASGITDTGNIFMTPVSGTGYKSLVFFGPVPFSNGIYAHPASGAISISRGDEPAAEDALVAMGDFYGVSRGVYLRSDGNFGIQSAGANYTNLADTLWRRRAAQNPAWGSASATPLPYTHTLAEDASSADTSGGNATLTPGIGRGNAAGSTLTISTPDPVASGSTVQTVSPRMSVAAGGITFNVAPIPASTDSTVNGAAALQWASVYVSRGVFGSKSKALTDGSPVTFATFTIADAAMYSGEIIYNVKAVKGTDLQVLAGRARFTAARVGTNYYVSISQVGTETVAASTGTLIPTAGATGGISISGTGGVISLAANYDTSFASPDTFTIDFRADSTDAALSLTFP